MSTEAMKLALEALKGSTDKTLSIRAITTLREALAQPQQEPVAWLDPWTQNNVTTDYDAYGKHGIPLYTSPPARKPLTDEEIRAIVRKVDEEEGHIIHFARAIEAKHNIKGDA